MPNMTVRDKIDQLSNSTVAIGLAEKDAPTPIVIDEICSTIAGTAFPVNESGCLFTAAHIMDSVIATKKEFDEQGGKFAGSRIGIFHVVVDNSQLKYDFYQILLQVTLQQKQLFLIIRIFHFIWGLLNVLQSYIIKTILTLQGKISAI